MDNVLYQELPNGLSVAGQLNAINRAATNAIKAINDGDPEAAKKCLEWIRDDVTAVLEVGDPKNEQSSIS